MDPKKAKSIFLHAVEHSTPDKWPSYLDQACAGDTNLRNDVELLLAAHQQDVDLAEQGREAWKDALPTLDQPITEKPGAVIGPYKLLQQIGEGGMGVVYMAEQTEPVERRVALKIIKPGMDTRQVVARFEAERQALAMMDHPNISKVFDAGTTDTGRPYFVMELVKGVPITEYCDEHHLSPRERLELFVPVCQAVQHAHQKGIIHRDIKPSNVMVAEYDDRPVPKIIDFGVAKAVEQRLTEKTMFTQLGQVVGTIDYMSPEQTKLNQLDIDTRSDIYSLGVLLYELLTGETPLDRERLHAAAFDEMLRIIREEDPPKPSLRLSSSHTLPSIAANRQIEPRKLSTLVRGELDWIVMKALEKDRTRRYETATSFSADIERYLCDEPVQACPPSATYRFKKFTRRNKGAFVTTMIVAGALLAGTGVATWQAIRATRAAVAEKQARRAEANQRTLAEQERDRAVAAEEEAKTEAAIVRAVIGFLNNDLLAQAKPDNEPDRDIKLRTVVDRAADSIEGKFTDQPNVEAAIQGTIGRIFLSLGEYEKAEQHLERSRELRELKLGCEHPSTLATMMNLANVINKLGRHAEAEGLYREVLEVQKRRLGPEHPSTLGSLMHLANAVKRQGRRDEAEKIYREVLEVQKRALGPEHRSTLVSMTNLASAMDVQGRHAEVETLYREVLEIQKRVLGPEHPVTLISMMGLVRAMGGQSRYADREKLCRDVLEVQKRVLGPEHPGTLTTMVSLAPATYRQGRHAEAEKLYREVLEVQKRVLGPEHPATLLSVQSLSILYSNFAWRLATAEEPAERNPEIVVEYARKAVELRPERANNWSNLGVALYRAGDWRDAVDALERADVMLEGKDRAHRMFLAMAHWQLGDQEKARQFYARGAAWIASLREIHYEHNRFRAEAEQLMGIDASEREAIIEEYQVSSRDKEEEEER